MTAYYNEIDDQAAAHLRALIAAGHIAPGIVDERSIEDVTPADLAPFTQCHFFAGLGVWSYALRAAGVADDTPIWTGSCPCQPFSAAGQGAGFDDERHLWPHFHYLIAQRRPPAVIGEQVASKDAGPWIDLVHTDMEALGYAFGAVPFPTAGIGGPHIRDRLYWVAQGDPRSAGLEKRERIAGIFGGTPGGIAGEAIERTGIYAGGVANLHSGGRIGSGLPAQRSIGGGEPVLTGGCETDQRDSEIATGRRVSTEFSSMGHTPSGGLGERGDAPFSGCGGHVDGTSSTFGGLAHTDRERIRPCRPGNARGAEGTVQGIDGERQRIWPDIGAGDDSLGARPGPVNGFWAGADWLFCRDGKWRPVEPGTQPLAHGMPRSLGALSPELQRLAEVAGLSSASLKSAKAYRASALRGYGNAINAAAAHAFIEAVFK